MKTNRFAVVVAAALMGAASFLPAVAAQADNNVVRTPQQVQRDARIVQQQQAPVRTIPQPDMNQVRGVPRQQVVPQRAPQDQSPFRGPNPGGRSH